MFVFITLRSLQLRREKFPVCGIPLPTVESLAWDLNTTALSYTRSMRIYQHDSFALDKKLKKVNGSALPETQGMRREKNLTYTLKSAMFLFATWFRYPRKD